MDDFYYSHYIRIDAESRIIHRFSTAFERPQDGDICITEQGGYQFRLFPGGEENPPIRNDYGVLLYKWVKSTVVARTPQEIEADRPEPGDPPIDTVAFIRGMIAAYSE